MVLPWQCSSCALQGSPLSLTLLQPAALIATVSRQWQGRLAVVAQGGRLLLEDFPVPAKPMVCYDLNLNGGG